MAPMIAPERAEFDILSLAAWPPAKQPPPCFDYKQPPPTYVQVARGLKVTVDKLVATTWSCVGRMHLPTLRQGLREAITERLTSLAYTVTADHTLYFATDGDGPWLESFTDAYGQLKESLKPFAQASNSPEGKQTSSLYIFVAIEPEFEPGCAGLAQKMWQDPKHTDMTITLEGGAEICCHRAVLAAASPVFDSMLSHEMSEGLTRSVTLQDVPARIVRVFLECLYTSSLPLDLDLDDLEMMDSLICLSDMYQVPSLAGKCAAMLCTDLCASNVVIILKCLGQLSHTSPSMKRTFDCVMKQVQKQSELLLAVCMYPSSLRAGSFSRTQPPEFTCAQESEKVDSATQTGCMKRDVVDVALAVCVASPGLPEAQQETIDNEKQVGALASIEEAREQENADLAQAILFSKHSGAELPLNSDGVVVLRLTRKARSPAVSLVLKTSEALSHCHKRVADAGCSFSPAWACGAKMLVPLTEEQLQESGKQLSDHHIMALASDMESIRTALKEICSKDRPKLHVSDDCSDHASMEGVAHHSDDDNDDVIDFVVEAEYAPRTDSDVGFPESLHTNM